MFLFTADWHLSHRPLSWNPSPLDDVSCAVDQIRQIIRERQPSYVLLGGDIADRPYLYGDEISVLQDFLADCRRVGAKVLFVQGQHDRSKGEPILSALAPDIAVHLHRQRYCVPGVGWLFGLDFSYEDVAYWDAADLLLTHQSWQTPAWPFGLVSMKRLGGYKLALSGDFHCAHVCIAEECNTPVIFSGALCPQKVNESKLAAVWWIAPPFDLRNCEMIALKTRTWVEVKVEPGMTADGVCEQYAQTIQQAKELDPRIASPVFMLVYSKETAETAFALAKSLRSRGLVALRESTSPFSDFGSAPVPGSGGLPSHRERPASIVDAILLRYADDPRYEDIAALLRAANKDAIYDVLSRINERFLGQESETQAVKEGEGA